MRLLILNLTLCVTFTSSLAEKLAGNYPVIIILYLCLIYFHLTSICMKKIRLRSKQVIWNNVRGLACNKFHKYFSR